MAKVIDTNITFPNMTVWRVLSDEDNHLMYYEVVTNEGYVMYDTAANNQEMDEDGNWYPVTYYYRKVCYPTNLSTENFTFVAVPESEVDENFIFGLDKTETN